MHGSSEPDLRNWQTQPGRIQPIDSSHLALRPGACVMGAPGRV
ncbi:hypothetical protein L564_0972 [Bordetella pertussis CHLA-15]|nr:hypothetical protein [Bordetella pertussis]ETH24621.1 hypothetical protein L564_0972 [Bordetella pertussis CHLA-15]